MKKIIKKRRVGTAGDDYHPGNFIDGETVTNHGQRLGIGGEVVFHTQQAGAETCGDHAAAQSAYF